MPVALVTGANGFIGRHLCSALQRHGWQVRALCRTGVPNVQPSEGVVWSQLGDLTTCPQSRLAESCDGIDTIFHLAARAHRADAGRNPANLADYRRDNVDAGVRLYDAAVSRGVARFVYLSSIKVLGDVSVAPLKPDATAEPQDVYASSKHQAEIAFADRAASAIPVTVIRPPLVYGPGVGGNIATLLKWVDRALPLPLGAADALRSFVSVGNLTDLLIRLSGRSLRFEVLHVRDHRDSSAKELVLTIGRALDRRVRLVSVPPMIVAGVARAAGRTHVYSSLFESLCVDDAATRASLGWQPPVSAEQAIAEMGAWWRTR